MDMRSQYREGERVTIRGREYEVLRSSVRMEGESEPPLGVIFNVVTMECSASVLDGGRDRRCGVWLDINLEFPPTALVCPACKGIIVVDYQAEAGRYADSDEMSPVTDELGLYLYSAWSRRGEDLDQFAEWFAMRSSTASVAQAAAHNTEMQAYFHKMIGPGRWLVLPRFVALNELPPAVQPEITTVAQLDTQINAGGDSVPPGAMSVEMEQLLEQYAFATLRLQVGELAVAVQAYRRIVSAWPSFVAATVNLANCQRLMGSPGEALEELNRIHYVAPADPDIHLAAAAAYDSMGETERELQEYQKALRDDPHSVGGMNDLGATYREIGKLDLAKQWLLRALAEVPEQRRPEEWKRNLKLRIQYNLALTYQDAGDWGRAVECWQACLSLDPSNPELQRWLQQAQSNAQRTSSWIRRWFKRG